MAGKLPYMPFYPGDWLREPSLRVCSHETKGVFIDMLCLMWECEERGILATAGRPWSDLDIARAVGGDLTRTQACVVELVERRVVSRCANGAIYSRRMVHDERERSKSRERMKKMRAQENAETGKNSQTTSNDVTPHVTGDVTPHVAPLSEYEVTPLGSLRSKERKQDSQEERIYQLYPRKIGKGAAIKAIRKALGLVSFELLEMAVTEYAKAREGQDQDYTPYPATWMNQQRWLDDRATWQPKAGGNSVAPGDKPDFYNGFKKFLSKGTANGSS